MPIGDKAHYNRVIKSKHRCNLILYIYCNDCMIFHKLECFCGGYGASCVHDIELLVQYCRIVLTNLITPTSRIVFKKESHYLQLILQVRTHCGL